MRIRQILVGVVFAAGLAAAGVGAFITRYSNRPVDGAEFFVTAVAFMAGALIYLIATDDPEARGRMLGETDEAKTAEGQPVVDLRERDLAQDDLRETKDERVRA